MKISEFNGAFATRPSLLTLTVDEFEARCHRHTMHPLVRSEVEEEIRERPGDAVNIYRQAKTKESGPAFSPVVLREGATRKADHVVEVHAFIADLDGIDDGVVSSIMETLSSAGVRFWAWTTFGHGWKHPSAWRVVVPFSVPVIIDCQPRVWFAVWSRLNEALFRGLVDGSTKDACRLHFYARAPLWAGSLERGAYENDPPTWVTSPGDTFDPTSTAEDARASIKETDAVKVTRGPLEVTNGDALRLWARDVLDRERSKLARVADGSKHQALLTTARLLGGLTPHGVSETEVFDELRSILSVWRAQGKSVGSQAKDESTIRDGIRHGQKEPIYPERGQLERYMFTLDDVDPTIMRNVNAWADALTSGAQKETPAGDDAGVKLRLVKRGDNEAQTSKTLALDDTACNLWERFGSLPGIANMFAEELEVRVDYRQPGLMLASGIALAHALAMRRFVFDGLTSTILLCSVAGTATGKGAPQSFIASLLRSTWRQVMGPDDFSSTAAFLSRLEECTSAQHGQCFVVDEYGPQLKMMLNEKNVSQGGLRPALLRIATTNTGTTSFAKPLAQGGGEREMVAPSIVLYGSTTPEALHDAIGPMAARDGFMGRHLWFTALSKLPAYNRGQKRGPVGAALVTALEGKRDAHLAWVSRVPDDGATLYKPDQVIASDDARVIFDDYRERCDASRRAEQDDVTEGVMGRTVEHALRVALSVASMCETRGGLPKIDAVIAQLACEIADYSAAIIAKHLQQHAGGVDVWDRKVAKVRRAAMRITEQGAPMTSSALMRGANVNSKDLLDVLVYFKQSMQLERYGLADVLRKAEAKAQRAKDGDA